MCKMSKLFFGMALFLVACGEDGSSEPLEYPEDSSAEICSSSENATISVSSDSEGFSSSEDLAKSSSSDARSCSSLAEPSSSSASSSALSSSSLLVLPCKTETEDLCEYGSLYDERDGQTYKTVRIGDQIWMAENLNYAYLQPTATLDSSSRCENNDPDSCAKYGRLYIWSAAIDSAAVFSSSGKGFGDGVGSQTIAEPSGPLLLIRGICPAGWRLPSAVDDWFELQSATGYSKQEDLCAFGFCDIPSSLTALRNDSISFSQISEITDFWASEASGPGNSMTARSDFYPKDGFLPIRCVKDTIVGFGVSQGTMMDNRDEQVYKTVTIKSLTWMVENLNYASANGSFCYDDKLPNCSTYGRLYTWNATVNGMESKCDKETGCNKVVQGVCPDGWHLPSKEEMELLISAIGEIENASFFLKLLQILSGPFAGYRHFSEYYDMEGEITFLRSATEVNGENAYCLKVSERAGEVSGEFCNCPNQSAFSVRCVKDVSD